MTGEEMERAIEFLLQGQADHQMRLDELTNRVGQLTGHVAETNRIVQLQAETQTEFIQIVTGAIRDLSEAQKRTDARLAEAGSKVVATDAKISETDARLDRLAAAVERYIEGRDGRG
jgi:chromosome segregation ATPase